MSKRKRETTPDEDILMSNESKKPKKLPKLFDGRFCEVVDWDGQSINFQAKCKLCNKHIRGQTTSTGNFRLHFK